MRTYRLWLGSLFDITIELDGSLNRLDSRSINLYYFGTKPI